MLKRAGFNLDSPWQDSGRGVILPRLTWEPDVKFNDSGPQGFFRIEAVKPLAP